MGRDKTVDGVSPAHAQSGPHRKTIKIEIEESDCDSKCDQHENAMGPHREMSPAYKNNNRFVKAAKKMSAVGDEQDWPRADNFYMGKNSLNYQEYDSKIWRERERGKHEKYIEWAMYAVVGILTGAAAFIMELIEESLVHFKDHFT